LLKNYGNVNEIFGGLGFNFIADAILLFLVYGPWKPAGVANGSTERLPAEYWLPQLKGSYLSLYALVIAIIGIAVVTVILQGTYFGLKLKAVGKNNKSSFLLGIPTSQYMLIAFVLCGVFAGLVGGLQVVGSNMCCATASRRIWLHGADGRHAGEYQSFGGSAHRAGVHHSEQRGSRTGNRLEAGYESIRCDSRITGTFRADDGWSASPTNPKECGSLK